MTCIGAGELHRALDHARRRYELPFHRDDAHLGVNWLLVAQALLGDLEEATAMGVEFLAGWHRSGRPPLGGFAIAAEGAALVAGLRGDDDARQRWSAVSTDMRRNKPVDDHLAYKQAFDALIALHRGEAGEAVAILSHAPEDLDQWHTGAWRQWYAALWAEAGALDGHDVGDRLARARAIAAGNPIAEAVVGRAEALASGDLGGLPAIAHDLAPRSRYQQARTLVLAGGSSAPEGRALMASLGATPMGPA
jgi:hypothetical protein